jgi:hypothetical protein
VVKYVNDPNHIKCEFDDPAVQLRQRALDAANSISGFDGIRARERVKLEQTATKICRLTLKLLNVCAS